MRNTVLTAGILHSFIRNSDIVEIASYSPFVNVCGAVSVKEDYILKRSQYYVFKLFAEVFGACNQYVETRMEGETYELPEVIDYSNRMAEAKFALNATSKERIVQTNYIDCVASMDENHSKLVISMINKHPEKDFDVELTVLGKHVDWEKAVCRQIYHDDFEAYNTAEVPENVAVKEAALLQPGKIHLNKHSIVVVIAELEK